MTTPPPAHYLEAVDQLVTDPVIRQLAARSSYVDAQCLTDTGVLEYGFMRRVSDDYFAAGGQARGPVGAIAHRACRSLKHGEWSCMRCQDDREAGIRPPPDHSPSVGRRFAP